jgi:hypothetical protein
MYGPRPELDEPLPLTPDEQREYEDYQRRCETSKFVLMLAELSARGEADRVAQAQKPTSVDRLIESESVPETADAFAAAPSPEDAAIAFLKTKLGDGKPHPVAQVHNDADAAGVDLDALHRARNMLHIETRTRPGRPSTWTMEIDKAPAPPDAPIPESARKRSQNNLPNTTSIAAPVEPVVTAPKPARVSPAEPVFEEYGPGGLIKAVPGMRLDVLMALQRK